MASQWFCIFEGHEYGPLSSQQLAQLASTGRLSPRDAVRPADSPHWIKASQVQGLAFVSPGGQAPPPLPAGPSGAMPGQSSAQASGGWPASGDPARDEYPPGYDPSQYPTVALSDGAAAVGAVLRLARLFLSRVVRSDFGSVVATDEERQRLATARHPIPIALAQDYAAWRRSVLGVAAFLSALHALAAVFKIGFADKNKLGDWNWFVLTSFQMLLIGSQLAGSALIIWATANWYDVRLSRKLARWGWYVIFFVPLLLLAFPLARVMDLDPVQLSLIGGAFFMDRLVQLAPKVIGLFPGIMRACLTLKSLLPESAVPGWAIVVVAPVYSLFFVVILAATVHLSISFPLMAGLILLATSPLVYVWHRKELVRPHEASRGRSLVRVLKRWAVSLAVAGIAMLVWQLALWIDLGKISLFDLVSLLAGVLASVLLLTVVGADSILVMLRQALETNHEFYGTSLRAELESRFVALTSVGLTD